jgi:hypothetical protein
MFAGAVGCARARQLGRYLCSRPVPCLSLKLSLVGGQEDISGIRACGCMSFKRKSQYGFPVWHRTVAVQSEELTPKKKKTNQATNHIAILFLVDAWDSSLSTYLPACIHVGANT